VLQNFIIRSIIKSIDGKVSLKEKYFDNHKVSITEEIHA
jgi:hypothetical protein